jgi:hypothetical protein
MFYLQSSALRAVMLRGPKGRVTIIGASRRDVEPPEGGSIVIDALRRDVEALNSHRPFGP